MRKINFYRPIMTLNGEPMKSREKGADGIAYISRILANMLITAPAKGDAIRQLKLAYAIYDIKGPMDVEDTDFETLKQAVKGAGSSALIQGQIEQLLRGEDSEKKQ